MTSSFSSARNSECYVATLKFDLCVWREYKKADPHLVRLPRLKEGEDLDALGRVLNLVDGAARGGGGVGLGELILGLGTMDALLEDGVDLVHVELGLEVSDVGVAGGVRATTGVSKVELVINDLVTGVAPRRYIISG